MLVPSLMMKKCYSSKNLVAECRVLEHPKIGPLENIEQGALRELFEETVYEEN